MRSPTEPDFCRQGGPSLRRKHVSGWSVPSGGLGSLVPDFHCHMVIVTLASNRPGPANHLPFRVFLLPS